MLSEDITFCSNRKCGYMRCERNPKRIKLYGIYHSFANFENTEYCYKKQKNIDNSKRKATAK